MFEKVFKKARALWSEPWPRLESNNKNRSQPCNNAPGDNTVFSNSVIVSDQVQSVYPYAPELDVDTWVYSGVNPNVTSEIIFFS